MNVGGLLLDLDGTLYVGDEPVPGTVEAMRRISASGMPFRYVTNTTRRNRAQVASRLREMGFPTGVAGEDPPVLTPAAAANSMLSGRRVYPLVATDLLQDLQAIEPAESDPEFVLVGDLGEGFTYDRLNKAFRHLMDGAGLVALQKNRYWMRADGLALDAGPFVAALEYASGKEATVVGKPEPAFFEAAVRDLGLEPGKVAMVGDDPESDVSGARASGLRGIQVKTGKYRPEAAVEADLTLESVARLPEALGLEGRGDP